MLLVGGLADRLKLKEDFMDKKEINIVYKNVEELIPYVNNPRDNAGAVDAVTSSIKNFGFKVPLVVDKGSEIVTGHTRLLAAKKLDMEKVPVIIADDLSEAEVKAFRLADNKVGELADWDWSLLDSEFEELKEMELDFDMEEFGFDFEEKKPNKTVEDREDLSDKLTAICEVVVECDNPEMQEEVYNRLVEEGYTCRVLTL